MLGMPRMILQESLYWKWHAFHRMCNCACVSTCVKVITRVDEYMREGVHVAST